jgi:hypothetical protein
MATTHLMSANTVGSGSGSAPTSSSSSSSASSLQHKRPVNKKSRQEALCKSENALLFDRDTSLISPRFVKTPSFSMLPVPAYVYLLAVRSLFCFCNGGGGGGGGGGCCCCCCCCCCCGRTSLLASKEILEIVLLLLQYKGGR